MTTLRNSATERSTPRSPRRVEADAIATEMLANAQRALVFEGHDDCTDAALARLWGCKSRNSVVPLFDPTSGRRPSLGLPLAGPALLAQRVYGALFARVSSRLFSVAGNEDPLRLVLAAELELARVRTLLVERTNAQADALRRLGVRLLAAADAMEGK